MLAASYILQRGTPFLYQGQELGMTNLALNSIDKYNDVAAKNAYNTFFLKDSPARRLERIHVSTRDSARTPVQWTGGRNAGFTTGKPWLALNENFKTVNALSETADSASVLNWYRKLAEIRKQQKALTQGTFEPILADHAQIFAYKRIFAGGSESDTVTVLVNLSEMEATYDSTIVTGCKLIISNYGDTDPGKMRPLEALLFASTPK
jgi:glycosidase